MHEKYGKQGLVVLGFPCNQFGNQEPGTNLEIKEFCTSKYKVSFDMFAKVEVNGKTACKLYQHLTKSDAKCRFNAATRSSRVILPPSARLNDLPAAPVASAASKFPWTTLPT